MNHTEPLAVLQQLLNLLCRSLPMYLQEAKPWTAGEPDAGQQALKNLAADQQEYARRVAQAIVAEGGQPAPGTFPIEFMSINDLSLDYLLRQAIDDQREDIATIERCAASLPATSPLRFLADEILGNARGHLEILEQSRDLGI
jgi:hypothetical protein